LDDLKELVENYPFCLSGKDRLKSFLADSFPGEKRTNNILCIIYECEMLDVLISKKNYSETDELRLIAKLEDDYGIASEYSRPCLRIWQRTFDKDFKNKYSSVSDYLAQSSKNAKPTKPTPAIVKGSADDYEIKAINGITRIVKYKGQPAEKLVIPNWVDGRRIKSLGSESFAGLNALKNAVVSDGITEICSGAFAGCFGLSEIKIPQTLEELGSDPKKLNSERSINAVYGALEETDIRKIELPENLCYIGARAFNRCCNLGSISIPNRVTVIHKSTFSGCTSLRDVRMPDSLERIEPFAFEDCPSLTKIKLPENVESIGRGAFARCLKLYSVELNSGLRVIEGAVFQECNSLRRIIIPDSVEFIHDKSFDNRIIRVSPSAFTVCCKPDSYAYNYAVSKGFSIEVL